MTKRPVLRYHGGKALLADWIVSYFPAHRIYVEPYGGAASVLLRKPRAYSEIYNDLDQTVVNLFRVLREPASARALIDLIRLTPFARVEFKAAYEVANDPIEEARRLIVRSFMGFGSDAPNRHITTGFRGNANRGGTTPAHDWANYPDALAAIVDRLVGITIENRDAVQVMKTHDRVDTLHYCDPPYLPEVRSRKSRKSKTQYQCYVHEMTEADHAVMLKNIVRLKGHVILSGYPSSRYDRALKGWARVERAALADGARDRTEVLWINPNAARELQARGSLTSQLNLF